MATWNGSETPGRGTRPPAEEPRGAEEGGSVEVPRKRRKKEDKFQAFDPEEKGHLKKYEKLESKTRKVVNATHEKLFDALSQSAMPDGINYLKERLAGLKKKTSLGPISIGFLGRTGAGKSSLINAIIGKKLLMPVSGTRTCTSSIVQLKSSKSECYEAVIHLLSEEEWRAELKNLVEVLRQDEEGNCDHTDDCVADAKNKLRALYGRDAEKRSYEELLKAELLVNIPSRRMIQIKEKEKEKFTRKLWPYIRTNNTDSKGLWPLVKYVEVDFPKQDVIPEGIELVDIPGTGDFNKKRDKMWEEKIDECSVIWIIADIERAEGEAVQENLLAKSISAYIGGTCTNIAVVLTKSDNMEFDEYISERTAKNAPPENVHDAILERNQTLKKRKADHIRRQLQKRVPPDAEILSEPNLVYTISAKEFWTPSQLSEEETEIPKLREYIRRLYLKEKEKLVTNYIEEALGIHLLVENIGSAQLVEQHFHKSGLEAFVNEKLVALGESLARCFRQLEQPLCEGVKEARRRHGNIVHAMLRKHNGDQGFHKTLKALCLNYGAYASRVFARIDFNEELARPIYDKIEHNFESVFRTRKRTRGNLWYELDAFKQDLQEKIVQIAKSKKIAGDNGKIKAFIHETNIIWAKVEAEILQRKVLIYHCLRASIQNELKPYYKEASTLRGQGSCERMKSMLREGIKKEVENLMFKKAKSLMMSYFLELKVQIVMMLRNDIFMLLNLVLLQQGHQDVQLPDLQQEFMEIKHLHAELSR